MCLAIQHKRCDKTPRQDKERIIKVGNWYEGVGVYFDPLGALLPLRATATPLVALRTLRATPNLSVVSSYRARGK